MVGPHFVGLFKCYIYGNKFTVDSSSFLGADLFYILFLKYLLILYSISKISSLTL